jgi:hydrogenase-4 component F
MWLLGVLLLPAVAGGVIAIGRWRPAFAWLAVASNGAIMVWGVALSVRVVKLGAITGADGGLRADALSTFMVIVIGCIALLASWLGVGTIASELDDGRCSHNQAAVYAALVQAFITSMLLAVMAANVGLLWVAIEATTIVTTFLVGHRRTRGSLEASWKYIVICTVGIALAFLGTVLVYLAAVHGGARTAQALDWTSLVAESSRLNPSVMRLAFALIVLGYGTKVGLAPMHSWLPDAHSQAPAPVSALMSGVLLTVSFYAILRFRTVASAALGATFPRALLVTVALLSLGVAASLMVSQRDYKRMLAYSSIEHMGLIALGAAAGTPLAIAAVLLHILGHGLAKSVLFLASGEILAEEGTSDIRGVRALLTRRPTLGAVFGIGLLALLGLPPFSLFTSELIMIRAEVDVGLGWAAALALGFVAVIFATMATHARHMLLGAPAPVAAAASEPGTVASAEHGALASTRPGQVSRMVSGPLVGGLVLSAAIGVFAWPLSGLLNAAARVVAP